MQKVCLNSKNIESGDIFLALDCNYIDDALKKGASAIIIPGNINLKENVKLAASKIAAFFYKEAPENCVAVTGTNGKSSVIHFLSEIWRHTGLFSANLGTNGLFVNGEKRTDIHVQPLTTPDCVNLHQILCFLKSTNVTHFAFEASSHALDQKRLHSVKLKVIGFTNLATDHLDYHKTKDLYFESKKKLFTEIEAGKAVFSKDDEYVYKSLAQLHNDVITFGFNNNNDIYAYNINEFLNKVVFDLSCYGKKIPNIQVNVFGEFQIANLLCSIAMAIASGLKIEDIIDILQKLSGIEGRMEHICVHNGGNVYVDYAHTAEGFENALRTFKRLCKGKLITVFGCGGDRDKSKRALMGNSAFRISDINIITDDNPRTEDPSQITNEIVTYCKNGIVINSRKEAIKHGLFLLSPGDFMVVIGKGHEDLQVYKDRTIHHNDKECILDSLKSN
ncbi:MAG: UDP-N-acetylmuramoyl-L-alanyl-D-glutamate--2,6-diaminopimelate ligase [Holosporales bacterium]|jgi:UDP-N-acetylmuramoyl-L-alanyl-D-glutamate--2,6-diaminopimelate ligase|nr:UDP-N-acetylmuramoyl-L-alanyl-D-glutamate--2,6-diaminopimelate ligase [Holosporales bacterium]